MLAAVQPEQPSDKESVYHDLLNDLTLIHSLLGLAQRRTADPDSAAMFESARERVRAIALAYSGVFRLLGSDRSKRADPGPVLRTLADEIKLKHGHEDAELSLQVEGVTLVRRQVVPVLLVSRELLANAFQHGLAGRRAGRVSFSFRAADEGKALLRVTDDGPGLPQDFEQRKARRLGLELFEIFGSQLGGELGLPAPGRPSEWSIRFPLER